jgi:hypothetical protein
LAEGLNTMMDYLEKDDETSTELSRNLFNDEDLEKYAEEDEQSTKGKNSKDPAKPTTKGRKVYDEPIGPKQPVDKVADTTTNLGNVAKKYLLNKLEEHARSGKNPDIFDVGRAVIGLEMEMLGSIVSDLKQEHPRSAAFLDKILDIANTPAEWAAKGAAKTYALTKGKLLDFVKENYGDEQANSLNNKIYGGEREIAAGVAKFSPTGNQAEVLKTIELVGLGKAAKEIFNLGVHTLKKASDTKPHTASTKPTDHITPHGYAPAKSSVKDSHVADDPHIKYDEAYDDAMNGGKHSNWAKEYLNKEVTEIEKGIKSFDKQIELHKDKIKNPEKYYPDFKKLDIREQEANINKIWPRDIAKQQEQKSILEGILRNRGGND